MYGPGHPGTLLLRQSFEGWKLLISGKYPLNRNFGRISELAAKDAASTAAKEHLGRHGLERGFADVSELSWRIAVRYSWPSTNYIEGKDPLLDLWLRGW